MSSKQNWKHSKCRPFLRIPKDLFTDADFQMLRTSAQMTSFRLVASFNGGFGSLKLPYTAAGFKANTLSEAFKTLCRKGWLIKDQPGGLPRRVTIYRLGPKGAGFWPEVFNAK